MRILVDVGHPAHVHFFKNAINEWANRGHEVIITARDKDVTLSLLEAYGLNYIFLGKSKKGALNKGFNMLRLNYTLLKLTKKLKPDVMLGVHDPYISQVGRLARRPSIIFTDTELVKYTWLVYPFSNTVCTPASFKLNLGSKHVKYNGYHELAYLHPNYFKPNPRVLEEVNLSEGDEYIIIRLISWNAYHDSNLKGLSSEIGLIKALEKYGYVFVSSERRLKKELEKYRLPVPPEKIHHLLYYAQLYIGEGGTMAAEAAMLGTPAIHIESTSNGLASGNFTGNFIELRDKYGLLYFYPNQDRALKKAEELLEEGRTVKKMWKIKRKKLIKDKIDVTEWMVNFVENYPESFYEYCKSQNVVGGRRNVFISI